MDAKPTLDTKLVSIVILLSAQLIIGSVCLLYRASDDQSRKTDYGGDVVSSPSARQSRMVVQIAGEIRKPGVYKVVPGTRVCDLIELAGGALDSADVNQLNLAEPLLDEQKVDVPKTILVDIRERRGYGWER